MLTHEASARRRRLTQNRIIHFPRRPCHPPCLWPPTHSTITHTAGQKRRGPPQGRFHGPRQPPRHHPGDSLLVRRSRRVGQGGLQAPLEMVRFTSLFSRISPESKRDPNPKYTGDWRLENPRASTVNSRLNFAAASSRLALTTKRPTVHLPTTARPRR